MNSLNIYMKYELDNQREKLSQQYFVIEPRINMWKVMLDRIESLGKSAEIINQATNALSEADKENEKTSVYLKRMGKDALEINKNLNRYLKDKKDLSEITEGVSENARNLSYVARLMKEKPNAGPEENKRVCQEGVIEIGESCGQQTENVVDITKKVEEVKEDPDLLALLTTEPKGKA